MWFDEFVVCVEPRLLSRDRRIEINKNKIAKNYPRTMFPNTHCAHLVFQNRKLIRFAFDDLVLAVSHFVASYCPESCCFFLKIHVMH